MDMHAMVARRQMPQMRVDPQAPMPFSSTALTVATAVAAWAAVAVSQSPRARTVVRLCRPFIGLPSRGF
jgi:hypothetical protein